MESKLTEEKPAVPSAVVTAAAAAEKNMKIMVAIDESDGSFYALKWVLDYIVGTKRGGSATGSTGMENGKGTNQEEDLALVYLVHVNQPFQNFIYPAGPAVYSMSDLSESVRKAQEETSAAILARAQQMCRDKKVKVETLIFEGEAKDMICQATEQMHVDLLAVGSRGLGMIKRAFLGSVSDYCAHHAKCPVLIVRPPKESKESKEPKQESKESKEPKQESKESKEPKKE